MTRHRHQALEVLSRLADGQPLCRIEPGVSDHVKHDEGVVAALSDVARRHREQPAECVRASANHVLQAWTTEVDQPDGPLWRAYREGGERAIRALLADTQ